MRVHDKDGILAALCVPCSDAYEQKRRDLYRNTEYGQARGLAT